MMEPNPDTGPNLSVRLTESETVRSPRSISETWDRLLQTSDQPENGVLLEVRSIWGQRCAPGHQVIYRFGFDLIDAELLETIQEYDAPTRFVSDHRMIRYLAYDPSERLPDTIAPDILPDPDRAFRRDVLSNPWSTRVEIDLTPAQGKTNVQLTIHLSTAKPLGWLKKRRWASVLKGQLAKIAARLST